MKNRSETSTFAGIPIPLTMETLLDAMVMADRRRIVPSYLQGTFPNAQRQYHAFRDRILRMDAEKDDAKRIAELEEQLMIEKEFGMHYHAEFMKLFEKGVE